MIWSSWSACLTTRGGSCDQGTKTRTRTCLLPTGGIQCVGNGTEVIGCKTRCATNCTFDTDDCGYTLGGLWRRASGITPSYNTGPTLDVSGKYTVCQFQFTFYTYKVNIKTLNRSILRPRLALNIIFDTINNHFRQWELRSH